jgi:hypothetical protein
MVLKNILKLFLKPIFNELIVEKVFGNKIEAPKHKSATRFNYHCQKFPLNRESKYHEHFPKKHFGRKKNIENEPNITIVQEINKTTNTSKKCLENK